MKNTGKLKRLIFSLTAALLMLLGTAGGYVLTTLDSSAAATPRQGPFEGPPNNAALSTQGLVALVQKGIKEGVPRAELFVQLGSAYLQSARETGDPTYYVKAETVFRQALELEPQNSAAMGGLGSLALSRHQFQEALEWAKRAISLNPHNSSHYGVRGDALIELGRYPEAFDVFQKMVDTRPDLSSYARVSYARELTGDINGAISAMTSAVNNGGSVGESVAWARFQLGNLFWTYHGDLRRAEEEYYRATLSKPDYSPALAGLARVAAARGDLEEAIKLAERAATLMPLPEHVILLGELLRAANRADEAAQQDALVRTIDQLARAAGMDTDLEIALFEADLGERTDVALDAARQGYAKRPSAKAADTLAWALLKAGQAEEARAYIQRALALGSREPLTHYHAGKIALALGDHEDAASHLKTALTANPHFSLRYAKDTQDTLATLTGGKGGH